MRLLNQYVIKTVLQTSIIIVIALMSLDFFIQLIGEFRDIGEANYTLTQGFIYVFLLMPRDLYQLFPIVGLIGCLIGLGVLASHSELIVMRAAGMSLFQISFSVILAILMMVFVVTLIGEIIAPISIHYAENLKATDKSAGQAVATQQGVWLRDGPSFIHIESVKDTKHLEGISRYLFSIDHRLTSVAFAKEATYIDHQWQVSDIHQTDLDTKQVTTQTLSLANWAMNLNPTLLKLAQVEPYEMSMPKLWAYIHYQKQNKLRYETSALNFWQRVFQPLGTCVMMFLAIPFIFGPLRSVTAGLRLVAGVVVGFGFYMLNQFFGPFSLVYHFPPFLAALTPSLLFFGVGLTLIRKVK